jgi:hypothetical protein
MNRDEKRNRFAGLAPAVIKSGGRRAVFPREPTGGTWISVNDAGVCLALINWHRIQREPNNDALSRGLVVQGLAEKSTAYEIAAALKKLPLRNLRPFRLIAIVPRERRLTEWRWNLQRLTRHDRDWQRRHWFSSGFDERAAERVRAKICASFVLPIRRDDSGKRNGSRRSKSAGVIRLRQGYGGQAATGYSLSWLRELHRSHAPERGPFSICMHRPDASTVSYTEIAVRDGRVTMRYKPGPSCAATRPTARTLPIRIH